MVTEIIAGLDVAEQGNDTSVLTLGTKDELNNYVVTSIYSWDKVDTMVSVSKVLTYIEQHQPVKLIVDANGIGAGVCSRLQELYTEKKHKCRVVAFKGGVLPNNDAAKIRFLNTKAQAYWRLRELFEQGKIRIPKHPKLIDQLNKMKWARTSSEKIQIYDPGVKEGDTAEEKSPDFADSLCYFAWEDQSPPLAFYNINSEVFKHTLPAKK